ncbi:hypothetical protein [Ottowia testudinis]|uniref:Uncharacterized protein n=1 Tax=Ottowia testudinis TaxID=2816950 RepID=A0A975H7E0_9BURK|nr:hypothetical protein [Ottowia testudinis]QTD46952.1 hypothetical protein J1M35_08825 [Ottowia testudinis]
MQKLACASLYSTRVAKAALSDGADPRRRPVSIRGDDVTNSTGFAFSVACVQRRGHDPAAHLKVKNIPGRLTDKRWKLINR